MSEPFGFKTMSEAVAFAEGKTSAGPCPHPLLSAEGRAWTVGRLEATALSNTVTDRVAPLSASPLTANDRSRDTDQIPTHETPEKQA